jgi:hypothetical protein
MTDSTKSTPPRYVTLARKTLIVPLGIMGALSRIEGNLSWSNQRKIYGRLFTLGILINDILQEEAIDTVMEELEQHDSHEWARAVLRRALRDEYERGAGAGKKKIEEEEDK